MDVLWGRVSERVKSLGFSGYDFSKLSDRQGDGITFVSTTLPGSLVETYENSQLSEDDLMVDYIKSNNLPVFQSDLEAHVSTLPFNFEPGVRLKEITNFFSKSLN